MDKYNKMSLALLVLATSCLVLGVALTIAGAQEWEFVSTVLLALSGVLGMSAPLLAMYVNRKRSEELDQKVAQALDNFCEQMKKVPPQ